MGAHVIWLALSCRGSFVHDQAARMCRLFHFVGLAMLWLSFLKVGLDLSKPTLLYCNKQFSIEYSLII